MYVHQDYPRWVYNSTGAKIIQSAAEREPGWFDTPGVDELEALRAQYEAAKGKPADKRWGVDRLKAEL